MPVELPGVESQGIAGENSVDYGIGPTNPASSRVQNVRPKAFSRLNPLSEQTLGREKTMFAFNDPLNRSSFLPSGETPIEIPTSLHSQQFTEGSGGE